MTNCARRFVLVLSLLLMAIAPLLGEELTPDVTVGEDRLQWTPIPNATGYDVVRGDLGTLLGTGGDFTAATEKCLADDYAATSLPYTDVPPRGRASWFLVRGVTPSQVGTFDLDGAGQVGLRDAEIEASPFACPPAIRPHLPIVINGDAGFTAANGVIRGTGTPQDPYLIAWWDIAGAASGAGISINGTSAWFVIRGVKVHGGQYGVHLASVANGRIEGITATNNTHGIRIFSGSDIQVVDNVSSFNTQGSGLDVLGAARVLAKGNTLAGNLIGINLDGATSALVHHNNLLHNSLQAFDQRGGPNAWDDGYPSGGNYWTNYQGVDQCQGPNQDQCTAPDGLGDTPYPIGPQSSRDRYPLMILPGSGSDTIPPSVTITMPADGAVVTILPIVVQGGAADSGSGIRRTEVRLNGGAWVVATGVSSWVLSIVQVPPPGPNLIEARSFDNAGNISPVASVSFTYQTVFLQSVVQTSKGTYAPGEPVHIALLLTNQGTGPVTLHFPTTCEAFFSVANGAGTLVYDLRQHAGCLDVLTERSVQPNETVTYSFDWNQVDDSGASVPFPADYRIRGFFDSDEPAPDAFTTITIAQQPVLLETAIETNRGSYSPGEPVQVLLFLTNRGAAPVTLHFPSGCEAFFAVVNDAGTVLYDFRQHVGCLAIATERTIQPNQTVTYFFDWNQVNDSGAPVPTPASYTIRGYFASTEPVPDAFTFITIGPQLSPLVTVIQTNKTTYAPGERVFITLRVTNRGTGTVTLNFPTTCQAFFAVLDASDHVVYDDLQHAICNFVFTQRILQPGQTATYSFDWFQRNDAGQQVPFPANYRIRGYLDSTESVPDAFRTIAVGP